MNPALRDLPEALRVNLSLPSTRIRLGPVAIDGFQAMLGMPLTEMLGPLMREARFSRQNEVGGEIDVYPLAIPEGEGLTVPIKMIGELGFRNFRGMLILIVPVAVSDVLHQQLVGEIASKQAAGPRLARAVDGRINAEFAIRLRPGMKKVVPLGSWGELGVEAA